MRILFDGFTNAPAPQGSITQYFGENPRDYAAIGFQEGHPGIDIAGVWGTPLYPIEEGTVVETYLEGDPKNPKPGNGCQVRILTDSGNEWLYAHLSEIDCTLGQRITTDMTLGKMGNTGFVTVDAHPFWKVNPSAGTGHPGTHCHLGVRKIDVSPAPSFTEHYPTGLNGNIVNVGNGFQGYVSALPYLGKTVRYLSDLGYGSFGKDVLDVQTFLVTHGYATFTPTVFFGGKTKQAVMDFQKAKGLPTTGYVGQLTRGILNA